MPTVRLTETTTRGVFQGSNGCLYERSDGVERKCSRCGRWTQTTYRWADQNICDRHLRVVTWAVIRVTTTFAFRPLPAAVYGDPPPARVLRRGDTLVVGGVPTRVGRFDRFPLTTGGFVMVPRSRWAWA
ncbi:hypothetical protein [Urbifossiella limnaea]|uniref:Uncharacterized protein n=1 Tax=Urbifossiella limnaea TaxID=2528023 RepID=A0A517XSS6_9BACT|nr:hypothetical protein [Urbifossiella limnaea]QDU20557.1 hypothetical protein ETAA1_25120 [Urbifossiella limnaea]